MSVDIEPSFAETAASTADNYAPSGAPSSPIRLIIGGEPFVFGLSWYDHSTDDMVASALKRARDRRLDARIYAIRHDKATQLGLGWPRRKDAGKFRGATAAAVRVVASTGGGSLLAVWKLPASGWWFLAVEQNDILPDGDHVYSDEADAIQRFEVERNKGAIRRLCAPRHWGITTEDGLPAAVDALDSLLAQTVSWRRRLFQTPNGSIRSVEQSTRFRDYTILGSVAIAIVVCGRLGLVTFFSEPPPAKSPMIAPSEGRPYPSAWLRACFRAAASIEATAPVGWVPALHECSVGAADVGFTELTGTLATLQKAMATSCHETVGATGKTVGITCPIGMPKERRHDTQLLSQAEMKDALIIFGQTTHLYFKITTTVPVIDPNVPATEPPIYTNISWTLEAPIDPFFWADLLDRLPGTELYHLAQEQTGTWKLEGHSYARN